LLDSGTSTVACGQAHSRGGNGGKIAPPIPNVEPNIFRLMKLSMRKPNKYFSANQRNCSRNL